MITAIPTLVDLRVLQAKIGGKIHNTIFAIRQNMPVILCSGFPERICHEELKRIGINHFIMKPISRQQLTEVIQEILNSESIPV